MAIIRRSGKVQLPFRQRQLRKHRDNKRAARQGKPKLHRDIILTLHSLAHSCALPSYRYEPAWSFRHVAIVSAQLACSHAPFSQALSVTPTRLP